MEFGCYLLTYSLGHCCCLSLKAVMRQATVQWVSSRQMVRHRLLPLAAASHTVFPACTSSLSLSLINCGPQLQQPASRWAVPVTSLGRDDDVTLVALGNRDAASKRDDISERSIASVSSHRCGFPPEPLYGVWLRRTLCS